MLLKKSQIARRQFSCCRKIDRRPPIRYGLNHVTEVASEVYLQTMRSPTSLHESRVYNQKKFSSRVQKEFFKSSDPTRTDVGQRERSPNSSIAPPGWHSTAACAFC